MTRVDDRTGDASAIDLLLHSPNILPDFWEIIDDFHGSDHLPISISYSRDIPPPRPPNFFVRLTVILGALSVLLAYQVYFHCVLDDFRHISRILNILLCEYLTVLGYFECFKHFECVWELY